MTNELDVVELAEDVLEEVAGGHTTYIDPNGSDSERGFGIDPNG